MRPASRRTGCLFFLVKRNRLGRAAVDLKSDLAGAFSPGILDRGAERAVDRCPDAVTDGEDLIAVPLLRLHCLGAVVIPIQLTATVLVVELAPQVAAYR